MIVFTVIYLGLIVGPHPVAVSVSDDVAAVELRLDGRLVGTMHGAPWRGELDFGPELVPRRFEAVALDRAGGEVARARQWLNLPQDAAVARLFLEGEGGERTARIAWESIAGAEPRAVRVTFDGLPLAVEDPRRFALPPHDPRQLHFLRAELDFSDNVTAPAELTFGGTFADRVSTELTAVPIVFEGKKKPPPAAALRGAFTAGGRTLEVAAVERGSAEIVMVVDRGFSSQLAEIWRRQKTMFGAAKLLATGILRRDQRLRFIYPVAELRQAVHGSFHAFPPSGEYDLTEGGFYPLLAELEPRPGEQRLTDAVAVAGLTASRHRRRRAVVLALGPEPADASELAAAQVRGYLAALRVPLVVWRLGEPASELAAWGETVDVSSFVKIDAALRDLKKRLDRQAIVWLDGFHLPQDVRLAGGADVGVRMVR